MRTPKVAGDTWPVMFAPLLSWASAHAQASNEAGLRGTLTDSSGAVVRHARITLTDVATNIAHNSVSDDKGAYTFRALPPATYKMLVDATGFGKVEQDNIALTVNQKATLN